MLFPVFARAREKGRSARCIANLRQIGMAVDMYAMDYDDTFPWAKDPADYYCIQIWSDLPQWQAWIPYMPWLMDALEPYVKNRELWHCPSDTGFDELEDTGLAMPAHPSSFQAYGTSYFYRTEVAFRQLGPGRITKPAEVNLIFDAHGRWHSGTNRYEGKRWNVLFADGHVKSVGRDAYDKAWMTPLP